MISARETHVAEPLITALTNSSVEAGGGFAVIQGGLSVEWESCMEFRNEHTPFELHLKTEKKRLLDRLEADSAQPVPTHTVTAAKAVNLLKNKANTARLEGEQLASQMSEAERAIEHGMADLGVLAVEEGVQVVFPSDPFSTIM
jgi:hypothetical protein